MPAEPIFTEYRRDLVARTLFDILKIATGAAFASKFFFEFTWLVRASLWGGIVTLGVLGFTFCPRHPPIRKEGR